MWVLKVQLNQVCIFHVPLLAPLQVPFLVLLQENELIFLHFYCIFQVERKAFFHFFDNKDFVSQEYIFLLIWNDFELYLK